MSLSTVEPPLERVYLSPLTGRGKLAIINEKSAFHKKQKSMPFFVLFSRPTKQCKKGHTFYYANLFTELRERDLVLLP